MKQIKSLFLSVIFISFSAKAEVPAQLNSEGFAICLQEKLPEVSFTAAIFKNLLFPGDLLLPYLALYAGKRLPLVGKFAQDRWSENYTELEEVLARRLSDLADRGEALLPNRIYEKALETCGPDAFCAGLISHNVLRTLGRSETALRRNPITGNIADLNPQWFKRNRALWLQKASKIQQAMISLHRDGSDDRWGDNYHFFGLFTFTLHEMALYHNVSSAWLVARANQILNPLLAGGPENPEKARIDRDSITVAAKYFRRDLGAGAWDCRTAAAYRLSK